MCTGLTLAHETTRPPHDSTTYWGKRFEELFIVPRLVFDELLDDLRKAKGFKDEKLPVDSQRWVSFKEKAFGAKGRGTATQSLEIKLLGALMRLRGTKFKVIQEMAKISAICLERFYYAWAAWLVRRPPCDTQAGTARAPAARAAAARPSTARGTQGCA